MTPSQVRAAQLMLRKTLPGLNPIKVEYDAAPSYVDALREANSRRDILDYDICIGVQDYGRITRREIGSAADLLLTQPKA